VTPPPAVRLQRSLRDLQPPASLFSGIRLEQGLTPDNILFFQRTHTGELKPEGVTNNYHHRFELVSVLSKPGPVRIGHGTHLLEPGECALIFPNQFHHYMDVEAGKLEWLFITFELRNAQAIEALRDNPKVLDADSMESLAWMLHAYLHPRPEGPDALGISYTLARLLERLLTAPAIASQRRDIRSGDNVRDALLESINQYVRSHLGEALSIGDIAATLGYSVSHLRSVFRDRLGVSLGRYVRHSRLSEAAQRLQNTDLSVSAVSAICGFESLHAFSRVFRKTYGVPPRLYRNLIQNGGHLPSAPAQHG
jgi:AraC-like DNA-binding protein